MREYEDALRSVRRYVAAALGAPPWRVRTEMDARFKRPFALVSDPTPSNMRMAGPSTYQQALPIVVQLYPELPEAGANQATANRLAAVRAGEVLNKAISIGVPDQLDPSVRGYPQRIPLWDYHDEDGVPLPLDRGASVSKRRDPRDYLWVDDNWTIQARPEASEGQLFVAIVNLRVQWFRTSLLPSAGTPLESVRIDPRGR